MESHGNECGMCVCHNCSHKLSIVINEDNQAAISIAKNPKEHSKTKHISIKYHFVRDKMLTMRLHFNIVLLSLC